MNPRIAAVLFTASLFLAGCFSDADKKEIVGSLAPAPPPGGTAPPPPATGFRAFYVLAAGALPYPNSLFFNGSTDGTMNLPLLATSPLNGTLNTLDGFSTTQYFNQNFSAPIDPASIVGGVTVNVLEVVEDLATTATVGVVGVLIPGVDYSVGLAPDIDAGGTTLQVRPLTPLNPSSSYLVLMTNGITDTFGNPATADTDYAGLRDAALAGITLPDPTLDGLRQLIGAHLAIAGAIGMNPAAIISSANFRTQSIGNVMAAAAAQTVGQGAVVGPFPGAAVPGCPFAILSTACLGLPSGNADIYVGQLFVDYYADTPATGDPVSSFWTGAPFTLDPTAAPTNFVHRFNPVPVATTTLGIPLFMTVPNAASAWMQAFGVPPVGGWPVVVFAHGITRNRTDMLALAEPFADAGFVVVAIDHPLHGLTEPNPLVDPLAIFFQAGAERTFDLDAIDNATFAPVPDGLVDPSGFHAFLNLGNPLTIRDAWRQGAADLIALARTIG
ncbi:MAG: Ig-like domain-containing protein, partial [Proteobacteria bacterium]|nr:Ig-like domain-containing protein [Pseudomonadota bacterium]